MKKIQSIALLILINFSVIAQDINYDYPVSYSDAMKCLNCVKALYLVEGDDYSVERIREMINLEDLQLHDFNLLNFSDTLNIKSLLLLNCNSGHINLKQLKHLERFDIVKSNNLNVTNDGNDINLLYMRIVNSKNLQMSNITSKKIVFLNIENESVFSDVININCDLMEVIHSNVTDIFNFIDTKSYINKLSIFMSNSYCFNEEFTKQFIGIKKICIEE